MNERMIELAKKAGLKKDHAADREYIGDFDWREFAELIVRECADIAQSIGEHGYIASEEMLEHFGVEK